jgi:murein DD-endopeptidase MepM/ murein hydrolase activator NlpD
VAENVSYTMAKLNLEAKLNFGRLTIASVAILAFTGCGDVRVGQNGQGTAKPNVSAAAPCDRDIGGPHSVYVCPGDTLIELARIKNVTVENLAKMNNIADGKIYAGSTLALPDEVVHVVQPGDTLLGISRNFGVSSKAITDANSLPDPNLLVEGTRLAIPQARTSVASRPQAAPSYQPGHTYQPIQPTQPTIITAPTTPATAPGNPTTPSAPSTSSVTIGRGSPIFTPPPAVSTPAPTTQVPTTPAVPASPVAEKPAKDMGVHQPQPRQRPNHSDPSAATVANNNTAPKEPAAPTKPVAPTSAPTFLLPVEGRILSDFGPKSGGLHNDGINIAAPLGTPIRATADGTVAYAGDGLPGFGNLVLIKHDDGWTSAYAHAKSIAVKRGDTVRQGQIIGEIGATGTVTEPQLHFELRQHDRAVDPKKMVQ